MAETSKGLPELSGPAWFATLIATLVTLALGVYPFVAYPAIVRRVTGAADVLLVRPAVIASFAAATVVLLVLALTGERSERVRSRLAFVALGVSTLGVVLLIVALRLLQAPAA